MNYEFSLANHRETRAYSEKRQERCSMCTQQINVFLEYINERFAYPSVYKKNSY